MPGPIKAQSFAVDGGGVTTRSSAAWFVIELLVNSRLCRRCWIMIATAACTGKYVGTLACR